MAVVTEAVASGWAARIALGFRREDARTVLARRSSHGPLQVQRPFYPGGGRCDVYLLHPPGGIVGGDRLEIDIEAGAETHVLLTTPAAGKFYRSAGAVAEQRQWLRARRGALLEWLPQETIVFSGARARSTTCIDLDEDARVIAWEILCLGRPASGESFNSGRFEQYMELYRQGRPLLLERNRYDGGGTLQSAPWGLGGRPVSAILLASDRTHDEMIAVRDALGNVEPDLAGVTCVDGVVVVRYVGACSERAKACLTRAWQVLQDPAAAPVATAGQPRIWAT